MIRDLTQEYLKEILRYDPEIGIFTWNIDARYGCSGKKAGHIDACTELKKSYIRIRVLGVQYSAHRLAFLYMTGKLPKNDVDHKNGNGLDNKWLNLRDVDKFENQKNRKKGKNNTSGVNGVSWDRRSNKWAGMIGVNGKNIYLGRFIDWFEAVCARKSADYRYGFHENHGSVRAFK